jgi:redox-regulated HSP33 family molecular chaperone
MLRRVKEIIMSKQRREAAHAVAQSLFATELAIDGALAKTAAFVGLMPQARQDARLSAIVGQAAMDHAVKALDALNAARRAIVEAHHALSEVQGQVGLAAVNFGALDEKPPYTPKFSLVRQEVA